MTKNEELDKITRLVHALKRSNNGSYCGSWLTEQLPAIKSAMDSDYPPSIYCLTHQQWVDARVDEGNMLIARAKDDASKIVAGAQRQAAEILSSVQSTLSSTEHEMDTMRQRVAELRQRAAYLLTVINNASK